MKKTFLFSLCICVFALFAHAQVSQIGHDVTIYSMDGLKFTFIFNGIKMNETPSTNVTVTDIHNDFGKAIIQFEDPSIPEIRKNIFQIKSAANTTNYPEVVTFEIVNKKGEYQVKWRSASPKKIQQAQPIIIQQQPATPQPGVQINIGIPR